MMKLTVLLAFVLSGCVIVGTNDIPPDKQKELVRQSIVGQAPELRKCYERILVDPKIPDGRIVLEWDIEEDGSAKNIAVDQSVDAIKSDIMSDCLKNVVAKTTFPGLRGTLSHVRYPFVFSRVR